MRYSEKNQRHLKTGYEPERNCPNYSIELTTEQVIDMVQQMPKKSNVLSRIGKQLRRNALWQLLCSANLGKEEYANVS